MNLTSCRSMNCLKLPVLNHLRAPAPLHSSVLSKHRYRRRVLCDPLMLHLKLLITNYHSNWLKNMQDVGHRASLVTGRSVLGRGCFAACGKAHGVVALWPTLSTAVRWIIQRMTELRTRPRIGPLYLWLRRSRLGRRNRLMPIRLAAGI